MPLQYRDVMTYDSDAASLEAQLDGFDESRTNQSSKDEADINVIVRRFGITGAMPQNVRLPMYGDFTDVVDFQTAQNAVIAARESFMQIPADVRARFNNDPQEFLEFVNDPNNLEEMYKLGLAKKPEAPVDPAPPVDPPA